MSRLPSSAFSPQLSDGSVLPRSPAPHAPRGRGLRARLRSLQPGVTAAVTADSSGRFPADPKHSNFRSFWGAALAPLRGGTPATTPFILSDKSLQAGRRAAAPAGHSPLRPLPPAASVFLSASRGPFRFRDCDPPVHPPQRSSLGAPGTRRPLLPVSPLPLPPASPLPFSTRSPLPC